MIYWQGESLIPPDAGWPGEPYTEALYTSLEQQNSLEREYLWRRYATR